MKGIINITLFGEEHPTFSFAPNFFYVDYGFDVDVTDSFNLSSLMSKKYEKDILFSFKEWLEFADEYDTQDKKILGLLESYKGHEVDIFKECEYVSLDMPLEDMARLIDKEPFLQDKKIVVDGSFGELDMQSICEIEKIFGTYSHLLHFRLSENDHIITLDECKRTIQIIDGMVSQIKTHNFSPIEAMMYAYDITRDRCYKLEEPGCEPYHSRSLTSILTGDYIVCTGYARLFTILLEKMGIRARTFTVDVCNGERHDQVAVSLSDDKYGVDGIYYFDPTADSKYNSTNNFLFSYKHFALTKKQYKNLFGKRFENLLFDDFDEKVTREFERLSQKEMVGEYYHKLARLINELSTFAKGKPVVEDAFDRFIMNIFGERTTPQDISIISKSLQELIALVDAPIPAEIFIEALYNVRKVEYYEKPLKYPFGVSNFYKTYKISNWKLASNEMDAILKAILKDKLDKDRFEQMNFAVCLKNSGDLAQKIERVHLTRTLRTILEKRQEEEKRIGLK